MLLPGKAEGSGHRHCAVPGVDGAVPAMIERCVSASSDLNECKEGACQGVRESVSVSPFCACAAKMIHAASIAFMPEEARAAVAGTMSAPAAAPLRPSAPIESEMAA